MVAWQRRQLRFLPLEANDLSELLRGKPVENFKYATNAIFCCDGLRLNSELFKPETELMSSLKQSSCLPLLPDVDKDVART